MNHNLTPTPKWKNAKSYPSLLADLKETKIPKPTVACALNKKESVFMCFSNHEKRSGKGVRGNMACQLWLWFSDKKQHLLLSELETVFFLGKTTKIAADMAWLNTSIIAMKHQEYFRISSSFFKRKGPTFFLITIPGIDPFTIPTRCATFAQELTRAILNHFRKKGE